MKFTRGSGLYSPLKGALKHDPSLRVTASLPRNCPEQFGPAGRTAGATRVPLTVVTVAGLKSPANHCRYNSVAPTMVSVARLSPEMRTLPVWTKAGFTPIQRPLFQVHIDDSCQTPIKKLSRVESLIQQSFLRTNGR